MSVLGVLSRHRNALLLSGVFVTSPIIMTMVWIAAPLPVDLLVPPNDPGLHVVDRHGLLLRATRATDGSRHRWMAMAALDADVLSAFLAMEDSRFFDHHGVDLRAAVRAARTNLRAGRVASGASTISMQTARMAVSMPRSWLGKARQALWALRIDAHTDKPTILEYYLNRVPLGQATVGVDAASALYFGTGADQLSLGQAAMLAALAHAPSGNDPLAHPDAATLARKRVLDRMLAMRMVTAADVMRAHHEPVATPAGGARFYAPHYTTRILGDALSPRAGRVLQTPLDLDLQLRLEAEVRRTVTDLADVGAQQAALVVLDNASGDVLAWVGSPDFWADSTGQVDMVVSRRQPGSALKPLLYGLAFDQGYSAADVLPDVLRTYATSTGPYAPRNYDRRFHGPVRIREALASSYNVPAVELTSRLGPGALLERLHAAGFASLTEDADHYGLGLSLGNGDVTLLEVANAYRAIANGGVWRPVNIITRGVMASEERGVMSARAAAMALDILSDPVARLPGFGASTPFDFPFPVAVKTGTSHHFTDNWAVGVTGAFTVAVWVGNFSGRPMQNVSGITGAGPLLQRTVLTVARRYAPGTLPTPASHGAERHGVCQLSGMAPGAHCPTVSEWFYPGTAPHETCDWHTPVGVVLPDRYTEWLARDHHEPDWYVAATAPIAVEDAAPRPFRIVAPQQGDVYRFPPGVEGRYATIAFRTTGGTTPARWFVDGEPIESARWRMTPGDHRVRAVTADGVWDEVAIKVEPAKKQGGQ